MAYGLEFSQQAQKDIDKHKSFGNKAVLKKLLVLLNELTEHPFSGTGKPEALKHEFSGYWSRRIDKEHRLVYRVDVNTVYIHSVYGHYLL